MIPEGRGRKGLVCVYVDNVPLEIMPSLVKLDLVALEKKIRTELEIYFYYFAIIVSLEECLATLSLKNKHKLWKKLQTDG